MAVYSADAAPNLTTRVTQYFGGTISSMGCELGDMSMAVGDLNSDAIAEIAVASNPCGNYLCNALNVRLFQVAPDLGTIALKGTSREESLGAPDTSGGMGHLAVAVGAFDGKTVRVGAPVYSHMDQTLQLVAVINAPPKHRDEVNGVVYDVNVTDPAQCIPGPCTYAAYKTVQLEPYAAYLPVIAR
jgi:hypothetical protein